MSAWVDDELGAAVEAGAQGHLGTIRRTPAGQPRGAAVLDHDLIQRTLSTALRTGGELAEIFVEDKAQLERHLRRRQGGEPQLRARPRGRDPGHRRRHDRLRPHRRPLRGRAWPRPPRRPARPPASGGGGVVEVALTRQDAPRPNEIAILPEDVAKATQGRAAPPGRRHRPRRRVGRSPRSPRATATAAGGSSSPTATASSPRTTRSARCSR